MSSQNESLGGMERMAIAALESVDLDTPAQQLRHALQALLDVPTIARQEKTALSQQAASALAKLRQDVQRLHETVQMLDAHIERPPSSWRSSFKGHCALIAGGILPVDRGGPLPYAEVVKQA